MHLERVVLASKNVDKIAELEAVLVAAGVVDELVRDLEWPDVVEDEDTLEGNALKKAREVCAAIGLPAISDDTGLEVASLGGAPGVYTARYAGPDATYDDNVEKMLREMEGVEDRSAVFRTSAALVLPDGIELVVDGRLDGVIATERRGSEGFGYDPIFELPDGRTLAEIPAAEKNEMSHRANAVTALIEAIRDLS